MENVNCDVVGSVGDVTAVETVSTDTGSEADFIDRALLVAETMANPEVGPGFSYTASEVTTMLNTTNTTTTETQNPETAPVAPNAKAAETKPEKPVKAPKAEKAPKPNHSYPFETAKQIATRLEYDTPFVLGCLSILWDRQTSHEKDTKTTKNRNRRGFMSSHAVVGCSLAEKLTGAEELTTEETEKARGIVSRYTRQLAEHFRSEKIAANPELEKVAAIYGV